MGVTLSNVNVGDTSVDRVGIGGPSVTLTVSIMVDVPPALLAPAVMLYAMFLNAPRMLTVTPLDNNVAEF